MQSVTTPSDSLLELTLFDTDAGLQQPKNIHNSEGDSREVESNYICGTEHVVKEESIAREGSECGGIEKPPTDEYMEIFGDELRDLPADAVQELLGASEQFIVQCRTILNRVSETQSTIPNLNVVQMEEFIPPESETLDISTIQPKSQCSVQIDNTLENTAEYITYPEEIGDKSKNSQSDSSECLCGGGSRTQTMFEQLSARYIGTEKEIERIYEQFAAPNTTKGKQTESYLMERMAELMPDSAFTDTSKHEHSGDFIVCTDNYSTMIECKNYSGPVPTKEVIKFKDDLVRMRNTVRMGIMVSIAERITGLPAMHIELDPINNELRVYVSNFTYDSIGAIPAIIRFAHLLHGSATKETEHARQLAHSRTVLTKCNSDVKDASQKMHTYLTKARNKCADVMEQTKNVDISLATLDSVNLDI